jgi:thiamine biosynthesis protein ThiS
MNLTVNGKQKEATEGSSITDLLDELKLDVIRVAVELNGGVVTRNDFEQTALKDGDSLEIVQFVGGG